MKRLNPLEVIEGEDKLFQLLLRYVDGGASYNLAECTFRAEVRDEADALILAMAPTLVDAATRELSLAVSGSDTIGKAGIYQWDLRIESPTGVYYLEASRFAIKRSITK